MSEETWTPQDDAELKRLRRKKARIERNTGRKHKYAPRGLTNRNKQAKEQK